MDRELPDGQGHPYEFQRTTLAAKDNEKCAFRGDFVNRSTKPPIFEKKAVCSLTDRRSGHLTIITVLN